MPHKYSICITHYNNVQTVEQSLLSILEQIDERFEVVVVDQGSTDGSLAILERLAGEKRIMLYHQKVHNRGMGRQLAFEMSTGDCIVSQVDMDDVYQPVLGRIVSTYDEVLPEKVLRVVSERKRGAVTIAPRDFLKETGGWPDLDYLEDRWIWGRATERDIYRWARFPLYSKITESREKRSFWERVQHVYVIHRDRIRIGAVAHFTKSNWVLFPFAYIAAKSTTRIARPIYGKFWPDDPIFCADDLVRQSGWVIPSETPVQNAPP
jgi:glycosyltransferase involved in cell wall biosynthesis